MMRWLHKTKSILSDIITGVGLFWLFVEIASYSTNGKTDSFAKSVLFFSLVFFLIILISIIKNRPTNKFNYQLRNMDNIIEVKVGDAFDNDGSLVIPVNNSFDVCMGGNVMKASSLLSKLISKYYSNKEAHLDNDISNKIDCTTIHDIGTTIEVEQNNKKFYLLASSIKKENNRVESTIDDVLLSLSKLWEFIALESGRDVAVTIPLIGTNHGRIPNLSRSTIVKEIIHSYIEASKRLNICDKLIISILPADIKKGNIDLDEMDEYLKFNCKHYRKVVFSIKDEGNAIEESSVVSLDN